MPWQIRKQDIEYFKAELWKDLRPFPDPLDPSLFAKDCFEAELATKEAHALELLREALGEGAVPRCVRVADQVLFLERVHGGRFFDIIRHLRAADTAGIPNALDVVETLIGRARERLRTIQLILSDAPDELADSTYPLDEKLASLFELFVRILAITPRLGQWNEELRQMMVYWQEECVSIPFRDATTKNMLLGDPRFELEDEEDADAVQRAQVMEAVITEPVEYWSQVPLVDIDFSSLVHLTSIEDDPISLDCHQWTYGSISPTPAAFVLDCRLGQPDAERAAITAFVRYLRFGGRKLGYYLINSQGFNVRFAYDEPLFYFFQVPVLCNRLAPGFTERYPALFALVEDIGRAVVGASRADRELLTFDHLRKTGESTRFWQQNPSEGAQGQRP